MKKLVYIVVAVLAIGCKPAQKQTVVEKKEQPKETPAVAAQELVGKKKQSDLQQQPFAQWFAPGYSGYKTDAETIDQIKKHLQGVQVMVFMGTWCGDSKQHVPHFYKIVNQLGMRENAVDLIAMDRGKKTPLKFEENQNIMYVPTFIFTKNGKELGRIVESPVETLEKDMLKIVSGADYKHQYER